MSHPTSSTPSPQGLNHARVKTHPCYSKDAHQFARIHLPVAPACNIQCNYCNRKFDCSNETRPGVVSNLLSPAQAAYRYQTVKQRMPELTVAGIAGPGDPLANPAATLATLKAIREIDKDVHLCVSTNGLNLAEHIESLVQLNVHHLTITLNTLDPTIGALLYSWVFFNNRRYKGLEAAEILLQQQLLGLRLATEAGLLVKVNTVLVPGVNDNGLTKLAQEIRSKGAFLHNIMPLISEPEHGTFFGVNGVKGPTDDQLKKARLIAGNDMTQMSHCQQCRADAVGKLKHDQSCTPSSTAPKTKQETVFGRVAFASTNGALVDTHFGYAKQFYIYDITESGAHMVEQRSVDAYCHGKDECHDDNPSNLDNKQTSLDHTPQHTEDNLQKLLTALEDCQYVSCSRIGMPPWQALEQAGIMPIIDHALFPIDDALQLMVQDFKNSKPTLTTKEAC